MRTGEVLFLDYRPVVTVVSTTRREFVFVAIDFPGLVNTLFTVMFIPM